MCFALKIENPIVHILSDLFDIALTFPQCSLSINRYAYNCHTGQAGLLNVLFTELMCGIVAQWLRFWTVNQETMGSNLTETIFFNYVF